jgi:thioredoxin-like negative regulator of GroEL
MNSMHDEEAKHTLKEALKLDPGQINAKLNLAGLYQHYGHAEQAWEIYKSLPNTLLVEKSTDLVHPKAKELYGDYINGTYMQTSSL